MSKPTYSHDDRPRKAAIAELEPNSFTGKIEPNDILILLGEKADILPLSIALDAALRASK